MSKDGKKDIRNAMKRSGNVPVFDAAKLDDNQVAQDQTQQPLNDVKASNSDFVAQGGQKQNNKKKDKPLIVFGGICIALAIATMILMSGPSVDTSAAAKSALADKVSTSLSAGTVLLANDENIGQQDYTITHQYAENDTKIWVWDYAAEDGDYVQILVNGVPLGDAFMIKNKPVEMAVPAVGEVQVKGVRDGGGGITYAVRYDLNGTNYFNSAPKGEFNTYTLIKE